MSNGDECGINNETYNLRDSLNLPTHGSVPKWLEDMSDNVAHNRPPSSERRANRLYQLTNIDNFKEGSNIPSRILHLESSVIESKDSGVKFGRRSSLAAQLHARNAPRHIMISKSDYLVPQLEGRVDFAAVDKDIRQADLEKSWRSLNAFQQTHKGRLDSAKNGITDTTALGPFDSDLPLLPSSSDLETSSCYSPSFLDKQTPPIRSKSEMSNYVPFYVYSKIKKATESQSSSSSNNSLHSDSNVLPTHQSISKAKSSEDIHNYSVPPPNLSRSKKHDSSHRLLPHVRYDRSNSFEEQGKQMAYLQESIEKHLNEYKLKVDQENRLRERIINELLTENERITERLKHRNTKNKLDRRKLPKTPSLENAPMHQKLYNKNSKYKSISASKQYDDKESEDSGYEKENLIEYFIEGSDSMFVIPELPTGKILQINILSTWGDKHYVGLNGIEIFGSNGKIVDVEKISASPPDVNVLPENHNDPRVVTNLLDGVNRTQDDVHLWLAPFDERSEHMVTIEFRYVTTLAMIRIWNYNKSRIHSFRGVRDIIMTLDEIPIFKGEIAKACGGIMGGVDAFGDTILFTTDDNILELISQNDNSYSTLTTTAKPESPMTTERPPTAATTADRPYTGAPQPKDEIDTGVPKDQIVLGAHRVDIVLLSNWGYANIIGLTGLEIIGISDNTIPVLEENISCNSRIKTVNLKALVNSENVTTDIGNMWWVPYRAGQEVIISLQFDDFTYISGVRIWNYNQSPETTYAGARAIKVLLDKKPVMNCLTKDEIFLLRRAPGNTHYDFVQDVRFIDSSTTTTPAESYVQINSTFNSLSLYRSEMPEGFVFQFIIFSTWGDQYYCGVNEIEMYNEYGEKIVLEEQNICAYPESINVLPGVNGDIRTPDKLIDGITNDSEGAHSWLAPIIPKCLNRIYIVLDHPVTVSLIKLWNYSKTPSRGIKEFGVLVDDLLIYNGVLDKYTKKKVGAAYRSIVFTDNKSVLEKEYNTYIRHSSYSQEVILFDENRTTTGGSLPNPDQTLRPFTSVSPFDRGYTSQ